jgi:hypothetical protein
MGELNLSRIGELNLLRIGELNLSRIGELKLSGKGELNLLGRTNRGKTFYKNPRRQLCKHHRGRKLEYTQNL